MAWLAVRRVKFGASRLATPVTNDLGFTAAVSAVLSVMVTLFCARHWNRECAGLGNTATTVAISVDAVAAYWGNPGGLA